MRLRQARNPARYARLVSYTTGSRSEEATRYPPLSQSPSRRGVFNVWERVLIL